MEELVGLEIDRRDGDDVIVARLTGEIDISVAESTGRRITAEVPSSARALVVDMSALEFLDSSGVSMLFGLVRNIGSRRQELHVIAPTGTPVSRVLQIVEFERASPVHEDVDSALAAVGTARG
jgi:anti-sigma B factor antagonist